MSCDIIDIFSSNQINSLKVIIAIECLTQEAIAKACTKNKTY